VGDVTKTNAARRLDELGIAYQVRTFDFSGEHLSAAEVAERVGVPAAQVYKTLLATGDRTGPLFAVVSALDELDLKPVARATNNRNVEMVPLAKITSITGYVRGGTTALAAKKELPVVLDQRALAETMIAVSAGVRGAQLVLAPLDYVRATRASTAVIGRPLVQR
jgi:Cys-tRNA(Pro)/Cys-tRNA(Cys) deacylase